LLTALEAGVRFVDTAPHYGRGLSERRVGDALRTRDRVVLSTKVGRLLLPDPSIRNDDERDCFRSPMPFRPAYDYTYDGVLRSHEASLQRLGLARVNILFVHDIGRMTHGDSNATHWRQLNEGGGFKALQQLRNQGAIDAFGIGVNEIEACLVALKETPLDVVLLAGRYTLLEQEAMDELLPACSATNTSVIVGAPYNSGILASGARADRAPRYNYSAAPQAVVERVAQIERIADAHATPMAAAALQFPLAHPSVASVIPGQSGPEEVRATLSFFHHPIPRAFWEELRAEGLLRDDAPTPDRAN